MFLLLDSTQESPNGQAQNTGRREIHREAFAQNSLCFSLHLPSREQGVGEGAEFLLHKMKMPNQG